MFFKRIEPPAELRQLIECYWIIENGSTSTSEEKIIPDGFPEIIFHYGDPFLIKLANQWEEQSRTLIAGQLKKFFFLKNTGITGVIGIKLQPTTITHLFDIAASTLTDKVLDLSLFPGIEIPFPTHATLGSVNHQSLIDTLNTFFLEKVRDFKWDVAENAVQIIFASKGVISVNQLAHELYVTERQLERVFRNFVGLSPKLYCKIIRFSTIFQCIKKQDYTWMDVVHDSGFYDQSHFIRNFKTFTGLEPSSYLFGERNLANFFMKKLHQ